MATLLISEIVELNATIEEKLAIVDAQRHAYGLLNADLDANLRERHIALKQAYRAREAAKAESRTAPAVATKRCDCGHTVAANLVMSTSSGSSCPDCYDRMSM